MSGYRFISSAARVAASSTPGSGGEGFSLDDSLYVVRPGRGCGGFPATYAGIWDTHARGWGPGMGSTYLRTRPPPAPPGTQRRKEEERERHAHGGAGHVVDDVGDVAGAVDASHVQLRLLDAEGVRRQQREPERDQHPPRAPPRERDREQEPGGHEQQGVQQLLPATEDPEPTGRRAADVPAAAGRVLVGGDDARVVDRREQGDQPDHREAPDQAAPREPRPRTHPAADGERDRHAEQSRGRSPEQHPRRA